MDLTSLDKYIGKRSTFFSFALRNEGLTFLRRHLALQGILFAYVCGANYNILKAEFPGQVYPMHDFDKLLAR